MIYACCVLTLGTLSIDNEMHDDDVRNPRRIGLRVSFSAGKRKLSGVLFWGDDEFWFSD